MSELMKWATTLMPHFVRLLETVTSDDPDPEEERQALLAIERAIADERARRKFGF